MKKRFLPLSMLLITMVLAQANLVANAAEIPGKYTPRTGSNATISSFLKSIRANQETGLIDPALLIAGQRAAQGTKDSDMSWEQAGPDNFGGETRAVIYDNEGNVLIGSMGGDIYKTTNNGITFQRIAHVNAPISCFAMKDNVLYIGTGDGLDAQRLNGLSVLGYETSFVGSGVYKLEGNSAVLVAGTENIAFVNEMAVVGNDIYAATNGGLMKNWNVVLEGDFRSVKINNNGDVLAADNTKDVYLSKAGGAFNKITGEGGLPNKDNPKIIAMSKENPNYMYIAYLNGSAGSYATGNIYYTNDGGNTWDVAYASTTIMYHLFGENATHAGFMAVYPDNPKKLLVGSDNLWVLEDATTGSSTNAYRPVMISKHDYEYEPIAWNRYCYLHEGVLNIVFSNTGSNIFFVGTDGGIFKGEYYESKYSYKGGNRYFITESEHTSPARMMTVAVGGDTKIIGGSLDHGTLMMIANDTVDNITTGKAIFPNTTSLNNVFGYYRHKFAGGPCAISTVNPKIMFVSGTGSLTSPVDMTILRTETNGDDYDLSKFSSDGVIKNANAFQTPFALFENYNDQHHSIEIYDWKDSLALAIDTVGVYEGDTIYINENFHITQGQIWAADTMYKYNHVTVNDTLYTINDTSLFVDFICRDTIITTDIDFDTLYLAIRNNAKAGEQCNYYSIQGNYPISYTLPEPPHDEEHIDPNGGYMWIQGDTITGLHDPIKTNMVCAVEGKVYMTRDALTFNKDTDWFLINKITGIPSVVTMTADGQEAFVGTVGGILYKFTNIDEAFSKEQASVADTLNQCVEMFTYDSIFTERAITSIAVNPNNNNELLVTLGNYGNNDYVYRSTDGGETFTSIQGNLGKFPVYSSIIEKGTGIFILGTEHGIYTSSNGGNTWTKSGDITCPVMCIKQAIMENHDDIIDVLYDEAGDATYIVYPGIHNEGMIYAATYGNGIVSSSTYKEGSDFDVNEISADSKNVQINIYPNPVRGNAQFNITVTENTNVRYQIFDLAGRMIQHTELGYYTKGEHTATMNAENLTSGTYIIRVIAGDNMNTAKFLVY